MALFSRPSPANQHLQKRIQSRYQIHRQTRNDRQRTSILSNSFSGFLLDPILLKLDSPALYPGYIDPRNCLVFWARPPGHIRDLVGLLQQQLLTIAPSLWLMPLERLHMTALEITHSRTREEIELLVEQMRPSIQKITDSTFENHAGLVKPSLSYDSAAIALSFLPAAGEKQCSIHGPPVDDVQQDDTFTYHHLRRELYDLSVKAGVTITSRYTVPSAHLTIARFTNQSDITTPPGSTAIDQSKVVGIIGKLEEINTWLREEYWLDDDAEHPGGKRFPAGEWIVGEEKGLDFRMGTLWYGGGETIRLGKGFEM